MSSLKAFVEIPDWALNQNDAVSMYGELTPRNRTFAKDKGLYTDGKYEHIKLVVFHNVDDDGVRATPSTAQLDIAMRLSNWLVNRAANKANTENLDDMFRDIMVEYDTMIDGLELGKAAIDPSGRILPEQIAFTLLSEDESEQRIRLWFSDEAFKDQYDEFEIAIIPPLDVERLDDMFLAPDKLTPFLEAFDLPKLTNRIAEVAGAYPQTSLRTDIYNRVYPTDDSVEIPTNWTTLLWGEAGLNVDTIKNATADYILANSEHTREEWADILPDIFKSTEYIIIPEWGNYAIPQEQLTAGMYSPSIALNDIRPLVRRCVPDGYGYDTNYLKKNVISVSGAQYKSIDFIAVGGPENRDGIYLLGKQVPDYIRVPTTSIEFNRMSPTTQDFAILINELIRVAEAADRWSDIPPSFLRVVRDGKVYIGQVHQRVLYLVITKYTYNGGVA